jgi:hypothetical protein
MEIIDDNAESTDPVHFPKESEGLWPVKVVQEERCVDDVERVVGIGQVQCVADLEPDPRAQLGAEYRVEPGAAVAYGDGVQIDPNRSEAGTIAGPEPGEVREIIARSTANVQNFEVGPTLEERAEDSAGRAEAPE